jgi:hypothetical protein
MMKEKECIDKEQVTMPMGRYNELMQLEREADRLKSTHRAKTIILTKCVLFLPYSSFEKVVETDDAAVEKLATELKNNLQEMGKLRSMNVLQFYKWKRKQRK